MAKYIVECEKRMKCIYVVEAETDEQADEKLIAGQYEKKFVSDDTTSHGCDYGGYYFKDCKCYSDNGDETVICSVEDLCKYLGTTPDRLERDMFENTECGMPITWDDRAVTLCVYAEGADAEWSHVLPFPFTAKEFNATVETVEAESDALWHEWNDDDEKDGEKA